MIFAPNKVIFIVVIQLLLVIVNNEVDSGPSIFDVATKIVKPVLNAVDKGVSFGKETIENINLLKNVNCFTLSRLLDKFAANVLPLRHRENRVGFLFVSQRQPYTTVSVSNNKFSLKNTNFNPSLDTVVIAHGFLSHGNLEWIQHMAEAFLAWGDVNVIVVDWQEASITWNYFRAAVSSTQTVGDELARLFRHIRHEIENEILARNLTREQLGKLHFVGHSLGAHIVARAADKIKEDQRNIEDNKSIFYENPWLVNRITGLDPAQPCFFNAEVHHRLDDKDAEFVDVIHTNARPLSLMGLGLPGQIGHVDFYPNGGQMQPGCTAFDLLQGEFVKFLDLIPGISNFTSKLEKILRRELMASTICSHNRAYEIFTDSILQSIDQKCRYIGHPWNRTYDKKTISRLMFETCTDCPEMGINSINSFRKKNGTYFTSTGRKQPYCVLTEKDYKLIVEQLKFDREANDLILSKKMADY